MSSYGIIRSAVIKSEAGSVWDVQLWKKNYTGSRALMVLHGQGFQNNWKGSGGTRKRQFIQSECIVNLLVENTTDEALLYDIFTKGDREYYVRIYKNGISKNKIWWFGWVQPSFSKLENSPYPYLSSIKATDSIGTYSKQAQSSIPAADLSSSFTINQHIKDFGDDCGLYKVETDLITNGSFTPDTTGWTFGSYWSLSIQGGKMLFNGFGNSYLNTVSIGENISQGDEISITFTIQDLTQGKSIDLSFRNQTNNFLLGSSQSDYNFTSNGNYVVKGTSLVSANQLRLNASPPEFGIFTFTITDISLVKTLLTNQAPCPTNNPWFQTSIDWWRNGDAYQSDDPFYLYRTAKLPFVKNPEKFPDRYLKYDVLKESLRVLNTVCVLSEGCYKFIQPNVYKNNISGNIDYYEYKEGDNRQTTILQRNQLLTLDGTLSANKGVCMANSFFTFEPPFKTVQAKFEFGRANVLIHPNVDYTNYTFVGNLQADPSAPDSACLNITLNLIRQERLVESVVQSNLSSGQQMKKRYFYSRFNWQIRISNGTNTYYLTHSLTSDRYQWVTTEPTNLVAVGFNANTLSSDPNLPFASNTTESATYPCDMNFDSTTTDAQGNPGSRWAKTRYTINKQADLPPITGQVFCKLTASNNFYYSWTDQGGSSPNQGLILPIIFSQSPVFQQYNRFTIINNNVLSNITDVDSISVTNNDEGIIYIATQSDVIAEETFEFEDLILGSSGTPQAQDNNIQYLNSNGVAVSVTTGFRKSNSGGYLNPSQLLCNEFLELQVEPLEIFQADIVSPDISPNKLIKYSINNDTSFKYYTFLGGSFRAQSETMSGEWFKVRNFSINIGTDTSPIPSGIVGDPTINNNILKGLEESFNNTKNLNAAAVLGTEIPSNSTITQLTATNNTQGQIYKDQKLIISSIDNSRTTVVTASSNASKGDSTINIDSITTEYPIAAGSIVSFLEGDITNVLESNTTSVVNQRIAAITTQNALGVTVNNLVAGASINKLNFNGTTTGPVFDNQKLIVRPPSGTGYMEVVVNGATSTGASVVNIDATTPSIAFPAGSSVSILESNLPDVYPYPQTDIITLTSTEFNNLGSADKVLVAAPGANKIIIPISIIVYANRITTSTASTNLFVGYASSNGAGTYYNKTTNFMRNESGNRIYYLRGAVGEIFQDSAENLPLNMYANSSFNGDVNLKVYVTYKIMPI